jgi:hypothetical protein
MPFLARHAMMDKQTRQQAHSAPPALTDEGRAAVEQLAHRHHFSAEAVTTLFSALHRGGGQQAQFSHPELGGMGQWSRGGMVMIGDMFNDALKARVANLANDAAESMSGSAMFSPGSDSRSAGWPEDLGTPAATGSQDETRYAFFPDKRRLAIVTGGVTAVYDTGDHRILGFAQQQGSGSAMRFTSQKGTISLDALPRIASDSAPSKSSAGSDHTPEMASTNAASGDAAAENAVIAKIEGIARLHAKGMLSDAEFSAKKAELLGRL